MTRSDVRDPRFRLSSTGRFMEREGPLGRVAPRSEQKLCLVATDVACLADMLYGLSLRADCVFVKYAAIPRDGMVLGRCILATDQAAGELCQALKSHPRVLASLQDDRFFNGFREPQPSPGAVGIWDAWPEDSAVVAQIHTEAFGRPDEAGMVERVQALGGATISLLAGIDGRRVGHILLSPVTIDGRDDPRGLGLAPIAVLPSDQNRGIAGELVRAALHRARLLGYAYVVVLGHPTYYPRFGFVPASRFGLRYEQPVPDGAFMAQPLSPGALDGASGVVRYLPAFS
jgi:putative acetyltransferase